MRQFLISNILLGAIFYIICSHPFSLHNSNLLTFISNLNNFANIGAYNFTVFKVFRIHFIFKLPFYV